MKFILLLVMKKCKCILVLAQARLLQYFCVIYHMFASLWCQLRNDFFFVSDWIEEEVALCGEGQHGVLTGNSKWLAGDLYNVHKVLVLMCLSKKQNKKRQRKQVGNLSTHLFFSGGQNLCYALLLVKYIVLMSPPGTCQQGLGTLKNTDDFSCGFKLSMD